MIDPTFFQPFLEKLLHLQAIAEDLRAIRELLEAEPLTWQVPVSSAHPIPIDKRGRRHLYLVSAVSLQLFLPDLAGQLGSTAQAPINVTAGVPTEIFAETGDKLYCPAIAIGSEVVVRLTAQNEALSL